MTLLVEAGVLKPHRSEEKDLLRYMRNRFEVGDVEEV
jgi:hypothetical protein